MTQYCADTSALVAAWVERYPKDHFPGLWTKFGRLIEAGAVFAPDEVRTELLKRSKDLVEWLDSFEGFFIDTDEAVLDVVTNILRTHPKLVMERKVAYAADPFVIALAQIKGASVLTEEGPGSEGKPRIPFVCQTYGVACCNLLNLIKAQRWILA